MRKFFAVNREGKLQAFAFFDPIHEGGKVMGFFLFGPSPAKREGARRVAT
jgi:hypothetical protein